MVFRPKCGNGTLRRGCGLARVRLAVQEGAQLAKAKRSGSRRRQTRLISCAGYAREQARSSPLGRIFFACRRELADSAPHHRVIGVRGPPLRLGAVTSGPLATVQGAASLPPMGAGACLPCVSLRPGAPGAGAEGQPRNPPQLARLLPPSAAAWARAGFALRQGGTLLPWYRLSASRRACGSSATR
jgi:hypothetical protein